MGEPSSPSDRALRWAVASLAVIVLGLGVAIGFKYQAIVERPIGPPRRVSMPAEPRVVDAGGTTRVTVRLETEPGGAALRVDGELVGTSPRTEALAPGPHLVEASLEGYASISRTVEVAEDAAPVRLELMAASPTPGPADAGRAEGIAPAASDDAGVVGAGPPRGSVDAGTTEAAADPPARRAAVKGRGRLTLKTKPRASVYLNGRRIGDTPLINLSVPAGVLTLRLVRSDTRAEHTLEVEVVPNRTTVKRFNF